ncbi:putative Na+/H+ antiporter [Uliginosibacterium sp. sgz301328]|uniref:putative Na+/H+ antiporter n=1 Tax=Uliginosibacterium sp. sgz301328 TaxID=3243764 RepID=UPI00359DE799
MTHTIEIVATSLFALAILHTFLASRFERLAHTQSSHAGLWHFFGEVEAVFGIWAFVLVVTMAVAIGTSGAVAYLEGLNFTEPMFVFAIMVVAASKPVIHFCRWLVHGVARVLPLPANLSLFFVMLSLVPLMGSFVTEPAAMTLAALMLRERFYSKGISARLKYATLGVLFVNVSIGGTLTHFAAPPVLMVAGTWGWDAAFMFSNFGWKALVAVLFNAAVLTAVFSGELRGLESSREKAQNDRMPGIVIGIHLAFLAGVVIFAHHPVVFMMLFLLFLGFATAYGRFQDRLILREGLMVALFLAGLVILGSLQKWWLQPLLSGMNDTVLFFGATALTAITDNAALTYLGSLVEGVGDGFKYALVAGSVAGGGLTVIANAPNPAGFAMLKNYFPDQAINPLGLLAAALGPTAVAIAAFKLL